MTKRQKRLLITIVIFLILISAIGAYFYYYKSTKRLTFSLSAAASGAIAPPEFLFAFSGSGADRLQRPVGVLVDKGKVFVSDSQKHEIFVYNENGEMLESFGVTQTANPIYMAKNPKDGLVYISDRRKRALLKFTPEGEFKGEFNPKLPKEQLPKFDTHGFQWAPLGLDFAEDGTLYVTEILNGHRLLIFGPDGKFRKSVGTAGIVTDPEKGETAFQFPNGVLVVGEEVFVADSNNQRIQVFDLEGEFQRFIITRGLPRGVASLERLSSDDASSPARFVQVDTLAHDATIWSVDGKKVLNFGEQGQLDGQFSYPGAVAVGSKNRIFIADTANGRVQAWGWPSEITGLPAVTPRNALWCLLPLLLLPLLLLARRRTFFATADVIQVLREMGRLDDLTAGRWKWVTTQAEFDKMPELPVDGVDVRRIFTPVEYSESDARALVEKYEMTHEAAATMTTAGRAAVMVTEDPELRRVAKMMEIDVVNGSEFVERFVRRGRRSPQGR